MSGPGTTRGSSYPFLQRGLPFFAFMIGGSYGISILLQVRTHSHIPPPKTLPPPVDTPAFWAPRLPRLRLTPLTTTGKERGEGRQG